MKKIFKTTVFWQNVQKTCAIFGGPTTLTFHMFEAADIYVILSGLTAGVGAIVAIWMVDNDKDGTVDIFQ